MITNVQSVEQLKKTLEGRYYLTNNGRGLGRYGRPISAEAIWCEAIVPWMGISEGRTWVAGVDLLGEQTKVISDKEARRRFPQAFSILEVREQEPLLEVREA